MVPFFGGFDVAPEDKHNTVFFVMKCIIIA